MVAELQAKGLLVPDQGAMIVRVARPGETKKKKLPDGSVVEPTAENIAGGRYGLARLLVVATSRKPAGKVRRFVEFMLSPRGQAFVQKTGHLSNAQLAEKK